MQSELERDRRNITAAARRCCHSGWKGRVRKNQIRKIGQHRVRTRGVGARGTSHAGITACDTRQCGEKIYTAFRGDTLKLHNKGVARIGWTTRHGGGVYVDIATRPGGVDYRAGQPVCQRIRGGKFLRVSNCL